MNFANLVNPNKKVVNPNKNINNLGNPNKDILTFLELAKFKNFDQFLFLINEQLHYLLFNTHSLKAFHENRYHFEGVHFELVIDMFYSQNVLLMHTIDKSVNLELKL
jgi:hypothetical protein